MKHAAAIHAVPVKSIIIRDRHRQDMGDLAALAESIERDGMLQPIGITEKNRLVFGERRFRAVRDVLKREKVEARIVHLDSILTGEYVENELRKDFAPSERVAIAVALKTEIGERRGKDNVQNFEHLAGRKTDAVAAEKAGFKNPETFRQAARVVTSGTPDLVGAMDSREMSVHAASKVATLTPAEQRRILSLSKLERRKAVKSLLPSPKEAREIAIRTGKHVVASNNKFVAPVSAEEERRGGAEMNKIGAIYEAVQLLAKPGLTPAEMVVLGKKHFCHGLTDLAERAAEWLLELVKESGRGKEKQRVS